MKLDQIYIPTLGRHSNQITWNNLPSFLKPLVLFVVQPKEQHLFSDVSHIVLPKNDIGMSNTRKWIYELGHNQIYGVFDDDLQFRKRNTQGAKPSKQPMTDDDWKSAIGGFLDWLNNDCSFAGFRRANQPPKHPPDFDDNKEALQATFYNGWKLPRVNELKWNPNVYAQDTKIHLQLILKGHRNRVWNIYGTHSKQNMDGGCAADTSISPNGRTPDDIDKSHEFIVENYHPFVNWSKVNGKIRRHKAGYRNIRVEWVKAYKHSQN